MSTLSKAETATPARGISIAPGAGQDADSLLMSQIIEALPVGVWMLDAQGRIWLANAAAKRLWGGVHWVGPERYDQYKAWWAASSQPVQPGEWPFARARASGHSVISLRMVIQRFSGELITVLVSAVVLRDPAGAMSGLIVMFQDINAEARAQAALREAHDDLSAVLGSMTSVLIMLDADGLVRSWNRVAEQTFGLGLAAVRGKAFLRCGAQLDWDAIERAVPGGVCEQTVQIEAVPYRRGDGSGGILAFTVTAIRHPGGRSEGCLWHGSDITERRRMEAQLHQAQKLEAVGQLASGIAHEINTPIQFVSDNHRFLSDSLNSLLGVVTGLRAAAAEAPEAVRRRMAEVESTADLAWLEAEVPKALEQSGDGLARVADIVKAMKEFSHPGGDNIQPVDLNHAIQTTLVVSRNAWRYVADVVTELDPDLPLVPVLPGGFNQVMLNLVVNAAHAIEDRIGGSGGKGRITVRTALRDGKAEISVADTGCGIPEAARPHIFEPFFTTKAVGRGTGQGLAIVRMEIVERLKGEIAFTTEVGVGTTFTVRIAVQPTGRARVP